MTAASRQLILGTAGHIDHGKTALIRALTGTDTDRLPEEKKRGMTIDIGFAQLAVDGFDLGIVDVPGHERLVRNMLAGATGNDLALLVVAADDSVMPQTREHHEILKLLGVGHGVIAVTKCDLVEEELIELVEQDVCELVEGSFLQAAPIVRCSIQDGRGVDRLRSVIADACRAVAAPPGQDVLRLAVDRSFSPTGQGTVITGSVASGALREGDRVEVLPEGTAARVRGLQSHGRAADEVRRGQRAAVGLTGVHHREIGRGDVLATPGFLRSSRLLTASVTVLESCPQPLRHRQRVRLHLGAGQVVAILALLEGNTVAPGDEGLAQLYLAAPVAAVSGQALVIRSLSPARTIGGGRIVEPVARRIARRNIDAQRDRLGDAASDDAGRRVDASVSAYGLDSWSDMDLCRDAGVDPGTAARVRDELIERERIVRISAPGARHVHRDTVAAWRHRIAGALDSFHTSQPRKLAMSPKALADAVHLGGREEVLAALLDRIGDDVVVDGHGVAIRGRGPQVSDTEQALLDGVVARLRDARFSPPSGADLAGALSTTEKQLRPLLELAAARGELRHLGGGVYLHADVERELRQSVRSALSCSAGMTVSDIRQLLGTTRRFALPICQYLDQVGLTRRHGNVRTLATPPGSAANGTSS